MSQDRLIIAQATQALESVKDQFIEVNGDTRISIRGIARIIGVSQTAIQKWILVRPEIQVIEVVKPVKQKYRKQVTTSEAQKTLETLPSKAKQVTTSEQKVKTISLEDLTQVIRYYETSQYVDRDVSDHCYLLTNAFLARGIRSWVRDILGKPVDMVQTDARINGLLGLMPGLGIESSEPHQDLSESFTVQEYLVLQKGHPVGSPSYNWFILRLGRMASASFQALKQSKPEIMWVNLEPEACNRKVTVYSHDCLKILDMAYNALLKLYPGNRVTE